MAPTVRRDSPRILVCQPDYSLFEGIQLGLAQYRNERRSWEFISSYNMYFHHDYEGEGAVIAAMNREIEAGWKAFNGACVNTSHALRSCCFPSVYSDDIRVGELAAEHFLERGFLSLAFLGPMVYAHCQDRYKGFKQGILKKGGNNTNVQCYERKDEVDFYKDLFSPRLKSWLDELTKPVGILAYDDMLASHLINFLVFHGYQIPEDIAVIGVNNQARTCEMSRIPLSSVELDGRSIGYRSGEVLYSLMNGINEVPSVSLIPPVRVVTRQSSDIVANRSPMLRRSLNYILKHLAEPITVQEICSYAGCSRRILERQFQKEMGHGPYEELLRCRIRRAKHFLINSSKTIEEISVVCGFSEPNLFYTQFRKREGDSPRSWRLKHLQEQD